MGLSVGGVRRKFCMNLEASSESKADGKGNIGLAHILDEPVPKFKIYVFTILSNTVLRLKSRLGS